MMTFAKPGWGMIAAGLALMLVAFCQPVHSEEIPTLPQIVSSPTPEMQLYVADQKALEALASGSRDSRLNGISRDALGPFDVEVLNAKDGDTVEVRFVNGPCGKNPCAGSIVGIRIRHVDSGETQEGEGQSNAQCKLELVSGKAAKAFAESLKKAVAVQVYHYGPDPYNNRGVASIRYKTMMSKPWVYYQIEALQMLNADGSNVFAYYDPKANERLRDGDKAFEKRKIWCK
jgi:endonuclease YncB( thermonuclease family)